MDAKDTLQVFDSGAMPWEERFIPEIGKALFAKREQLDSMPESFASLELIAIALIDSRPA